MPNQDKGYKKNEYGRGYFGDKTAKYLEQKSRQAVETYHNAPILYFEIDWKKSKRNFYGEMLIKKFVDNKGTEVRGIYNIGENSPEMENGMPNKTMKLTVSVYVEQLKELGISPKIGDYFSIGRRFYQIYAATTEDVGPGNLMMNRGRMRQDFLCMEEKDEALQKDVWGETLGNELDVKPGNSNV